MALAMVRERTLRKVCQLGLQRLWSVLEHPVECSLQRGFATHGVSDASSRMGLVKFYKTVGVRPAGSGYEVTLDRYSLKSPAKKPLILPTLELAKAIAAEWDHQGARIDANTMPLMSLASTAIDQPQAQDYVAEAIVSYLPSDPVLCRVEESEGALHQKQIELLDPVLGFVRNHLGLSLQPSTSIFGASVDEEDSNRVKNYILGLDVWKCSALEQLAGACKSVCIAIAGVEGQLSLQQVIEASRIEESHQIEEWGLVEGGHDIDIAELNVAYERALQLREQVHRSSMDIVLVESDGECRVLKSSIPNILSTYPPGVYTTMYADACGQIEDKATHVRRLEMSIEAVNRHYDGIFGDITSLFGLKGLGDHIGLQIDNFSALALDKSSLVKSHEGKGRMVVFCICPGNLHQACGGNPNYSASLTCSCMVAPYSRESSQKCIKAIILGAPRKIPLAKDIGWVSERRYLQDIASQELGEILLCKENGEILEGLVTNFFVVRKETRNEGGITVVQTAPVSAGVVWGTARKHVLEICSDLCIQVDESCPVPSDRDKWTEAFVTNSLRKVQPIESIECSDKNVFGLEPWSVHFQKCPGQVTKHIMRAMNKKIQ